jgi:hypothetical protein
MKEGIILNGGFQKPGNISVGTCRGPSFSREAEENHGDLM